MRFFRVISILMIGALATTSLDAQASLSAPTGGPLQPGDRLELVIYPATEYNGVYTVAADGSLLHPLLSTVVVSGMDLEAARDRIDRFLKSNVLEDPLFLFQPLYRIWVGGEVSQQGQYFFPAGTVGQAIIEAGGSTTPNRDLRVRLIRGGQSIVENLDGASETELLQTSIRSGDQILVERRPSINRMYITPMLQVLQTLTGLVATYVYLDAIFGGG